MEFAAPELLKPYTDTLWHGSIMQTLWSRIAQLTGSCRCPQCISSVSGVSRRATTSASTRARQLPISSTLWYSGIFAAAATFDAGAKKRRRAQWDRAIEDARTDLDQPARLENPLKNHLGVKPEDDGWEDLLLDMDLADNLDSSSLRLNVPEWPTNTGPQLEVNHLPPQSIYASKSRKQQGDQVRWVKKKLQRVQLSVDILQLEILEELDRRGDLNAAAAATPDHYPASIWESREQRRSMLKQKRNDYARIKESDENSSGWRRSETDIPLCHYEQDHAGSYHSVAREMNQAIQNLIQAQAQKKMTEASCLAKIAYNLSVSSAPPNIDTYNTLIVGLTQLRQFEMVRLVIDSLRQTRMRPNEVTLASVLSFYTRVQDFEKFQFWIKLMRGMRGGLHTARPDIVINTTNQTRLIRKPDQPEVIIQLPYPTPMVFGALIKGIVKFWGFDTALKVCQTLGNEGWGLCMGGLTPLLQDCADRRDWTSGIAVWQQIQDLKMTCLKDRASQKRAEILGLPTFMAMLQLCSRCDQKEKFEEVIDEAINTHRISALELVDKMQAQLDAKNKLMLPEIAPEQQTVGRPSSRPRQKPHKTFRPVHRINLEHKSSGKGQETVDNELPREVEHKPAPPEEPSSTSSTQRPSTPLLSPPSLEHLRRIPSTLYMPGGNGMLERPIAVPG